MKAIRDALKDRLQDQFRQEWSSTMEASTKCVLYRNLKIKFELEAYLLRLPRNIWRNIVKLRCSNHKLEIETGRYAGIDRDLWYCGKCATNIIGDEYHVFFECSNANISLQRNLFIPTYFRQNRSMFNHTINRATFVCLFVPYLLRGPLTGLCQTWWVYVGGPRNCP